MKIVINEAYGGFGLSGKAMKQLMDIKGLPCNFFYHEYNTNEWTPTDLTDGYCIFALSIDDVGLVQDPWNYLIKDDTFRRNDPDLVEIVERLSNAADGDCANLKIVEIPDDVDWTIENHAGREWVAEKHRTWN